MKGAGPEPLDKVIGGNIRRRRRERRMSQSELASRIDVTYQQVQKYETARCRVSASRLYRIAYVLGRPVTSFFIE